MATKEIFFRRPQELNIDTAFFPFGDDLIFSKVFRLGFLDLLNFRSNRLMTGHWSENISDYKFLITDENMSRLSNLYEAVGPSGVQEWFRNQRSITYNVGGSARRDVFPRRWNVIGNDYIPLAPYNLPSLSDSYFNISLSGDYNNTIVENSCVYDFDKRFLKILPPNNRISFYVRLRNYMKLPQNGSSNYDINAPLTAAGLDPQDFNVGDKVNLANKYYQPWDLTFLDTSTNTFDNNFHIGFSASSIFEAPIAIKDSSGRDNQMIITEYYIKYTLRSSSINPYRYITSSYYNENVTTPFVNSIRHSITGQLLDLSSRYSNEAASVVKQRPFYPDQYYFHLLLAELRCADIFLYPKKGYLLNDAGTSGSDYRFTINRREVFNTSPSRNIYTSRSNSDLDRRVSRSFGTPTGEYSVTAYFTSQTDPVTRTPATDPTLDPPSNPPDNPPVNQPPPEEPVTDEPVEPSAPPAPVITVGSDGSYMDILWTLTGDIESYYTPSSFGITRFEEGQIGVVGVFIETFYPSEPGYNDPDVHLGNSLYGEKSIYAHGAASRMIGNTGRFGEQCDSGRKLNTSALNTGWNGFSKCLVRESGFILAGLAMSVTRFNGANYTDRCLKDAAIDDPCRASFYYDKRTFMRIVWEVSTSRANGAAFKKYIKSDWTEYNVPIEALQVNEPPSPVRFDLARYPRGYLDSSPALIPSISYPVTSGPNYAEIKCIHLNENEFKIRPEFNDINRYRVELTKWPEIGINLERNGQLTLPGSPDESSTIVYEIPSSEWITNRSPLNDVQNYPGAPSADYSASAFYNTIRIENLEDKMGYVATITALGLYGESPPGVTVQSQPSNKIYFRTTEYDLVEYKIVKSSDEVTERPFFRLVPVNNTPSSVPVDRIRLEYATERLNSYPPLDSDWKPLDDINFVDNPDLLINYDKDINFEPIVYPFFSTGRWLVRAVSILDDTNTTKISSIGNYVDLDRQNFGGILFSVPRAIATQPSYSDNLFSLNFEKISYTKTFLPGVDFFIDRTQDVLQLKPNIFCVLRAPGDFDDDGNLLDPRRILTLVKQDPDSKIYDLITEITLSDEFNNCQLFNNSIVFSDPNTYTVQLTDTGNNIREIQIQLQNNESDAQITADATIVDPSPRIDTNFNQGLIRFKPDNGGYIGKDYYNSLDSNVLNIRDNNNFEKGFLPSGEAFQPWQQWRDVGLGKDQILGDVVFWDEKVFLLEDDDGIPFNDILPETPKIVSVNKITGTETQGFSLIKVNLQTRNLNRNTFRSYLVQKYIDNNWIDTNPDRTNIDPNDTNNLTEISFKVFTAEAEAKYRVAVVTGNYTGQRLLSKFKEFSTLFNNIVSEDFN